MNTSLMTFLKSPPLVCAVFTVLNMVSGGKSSDRTAFFWKCWFNKAGTSWCPIIEAMPFDFFPAANCLMLETTPQKRGAPGLPRFPTTCGVFGEIRLPVFPIPLKQEGQKDAAELACTVSELPKWTLTSSNNQVSLVASSSLDKGKQWSCLVWGCNGQVVADMESLVTFIMSVLRQHFYAWAAECSGLLLLLCLPTTRLRSVVPLSDKR